MILYLNNFSDVKLLDVGGLVHFNVVHGEWYRIVTSMFLHFSFEHILMNMLSLFILQNSRSNYWFMEDVNCILYCRAVWKLCITII